MMDFRKGFWLAAAASALCACASKPPSSGGSAVASSSTPAASPAGPNTGSSAVPKGYRRVVRKGTEYFCRTEAVTASHALRQEVCLTRDQLARWNDTVVIGRNPTPAGQGGAASPMR
jgi:hypothetical protein